MSTLRLIWIYPAMGRAGRPWLDHPDRDAFARSSNAVWELYSESLRAANIPNRHSEVRLFCRVEDDRGDAVVTVHPELTEGFEMGVIALPPGLAGLTPQARAELVLEVVHAAATRLGQDRGWDQSALDAARAHALAAGLQYRCSGPAKTSPDRRHVAQPAYAIYPDGYGRAVVQVRRRDDGTVVAVSPLVAEAGHTYLKEFTHDPGKLRWRSRTVVEYKPQGGLAVGPSGETVAGPFYPDPIRLDLDDPATFGDPAGLPPGDYDPAAKNTIPPVRAEVPADEGPRLHVLGGYVDPGLSPRYSGTLLHYLGQMRGPEWQAWWAGAGIRELEVDYSFDSASSGISARQAGDTLRTTIRRPLRAFPTDREPEAVAQSDVTALLTTIRRRTGLGEPPPLH